MDTLTIEHQDGALTLRLVKGGYSIKGDAITISVETGAISDDQYPERALFSLVNAPMTAELQPGLEFRARSLSGETVEGYGTANAYFNDHADDVAIVWTVHEVRLDRVVFSLEAEHDDVDYYDERARRTRTTGLFALASRPERELWAPL